MTASLQNAVVQTPAAAPTRRDGTDVDIDILIARLCHDLGASVRALADLPQWLAEDLAESHKPLPDDAKRLTQMMTDHAGRIDGVLAGLSAYRQAGLAPVLGPLRPSTVFEAALSRLSVPRHAELRHQIDGAALRIGEEDLQQVFAIPLSNALKFGTRPKVSVQAGPTGSGGWRSVTTDDGGGIPDHLRPAVLQPLVKLVSRDADPGAGMGLAILDRLAKQYGGGVEIEPGPGGTGCAVTVTLNDV